MTEANREDDATVDRALIDRWMEGDQRAATELVTRHAPALSRFAVQLGVRDDVDEVVQETFIRAFGALDGFRADSALRTWLFTILRRLVIDRRRSTQRRGTEVELGETDVSTEYDALDGMVADESVRRIGAAMRRLSPMQRDVFTLRVQEGRSYREIAEVLGTTEGSARVHYHNAMRAIKEALDD